LTWKKYYMAENAFIMHIISIQWPSSDTLKKQLSRPSETGKCQSLTTLSHFATFLSSFCDICLTIRHFFLLAKTWSQKSKTLLQICLM
jgi:hypothetical protein